MATGKLPAGTGEASKIPLIDFRAGIVWKPCWFMMIALIKKRQYDDHSWDTWVTILSLRSWSVRLGTARDLGFDTLEKPNRWKLPPPEFSEPRESQSERLCSESENPGGGAR